MKKVLGLTSLALLGVVALTGCSCGKNGEYTFSHFEYTVDGETKKTDCKNTEGLPEDIALTCSFVTEMIKEDEVFFVIDGNKMTSEDGENVAYIKFDGEKILIAEKEDGEYEDSEMRYKNGKIYMDFSENFTVVLDN